MEQLRQQVEAMSTQLDSASKANASLSARLQQMGDTTSAQIGEVAQQMGTLDQRLSGMDRQVVGIGEHVVGIDDQMSGIGQQIANIDHDITGLNELVAGLDEQIALAVETEEDPFTPPPLDPTPMMLPRPTTPLVWTISDQEVLSELRSRLDRLERQIGEVDARVSATSKELANQIDELSGDIDRSRESDSANDSDSGGRVGTNNAASQGSGSPESTDPATDVAGSDLTGSAGADPSPDNDHAAPDADDAATRLAELREAQAHLAKEQARYQIQFRKDLAALAERIVSPDDDTPAN